MGLESQCASANISLNVGPADSAPELFFISGMKTFAERLRLAIDEAGMTPYSVAKQVGLSANYVSRLLKSGSSQHARANVKPSTLAKIAHVTAVRREWLGFGEGEMKHEDEKRIHLAMLTPFDVACAYWRPHVSESAIVAVEAWARKHDPPEMPPLLWGQLIQEAQRQLTEGREPVLPPPRPVEADEAEPLLLPASDDGNGDVKAG